MTELRKQVSGFAWFNLKSPLFYECTASESFQSDLCKQLVTDYLSHAGFRSLQMDFHCSQK